MSDKTEKDVKVIAAVACEFERTAIGTRSRLRDFLAGKMVLAHVVDRLLAVEGLSEIVLLVPAEQMDAAEVFKADARVRVMELQRRPAAIDTRMRIGRAWNLCGWRGGAGQMTCFDEEYAPEAIAHACTELSADHVLAVHSHSVLLDVEMTAALLQHHLYKNHEMRVTYTPSAPGLCGMFLRADIAVEMGEKSVMPWQLLAYDPQNPNFDTLIREACMQVDPALSKIPNRFCADTDRGWALCERLLKQGPFGCTAELALAAAQTIAAGVREFSSVADYPRELEIELTGRRLINPPGSVPALVREGRGELDGAYWERWLSAQSFPDDLLLTFAGDGDAALYPGFLEVLRAVRRSRHRPLSVCVQTDLLGEETAPLWEAIAESLIDVLTIPMFGHSAETYETVSGGGSHAALMRNLTKLAAAATAGGGVPIVIPRLLKVRDTIPELEAFFDSWLQQAGWAVIEGPTDRAGSVPFEAVVDMGPSKRRPCRRLWDRLLIRANGNVVACDQDMNDVLSLGNIESKSLQELWKSKALVALREKHADGRWNEIVPCGTCREWHRP